MSLLNLFTLIIFSIFDRIYSCGMLTHIEITERALFTFKQKSNSSIDYLSWMQEEKDALIGGSPYPDFGYSCGFANTSEESHWPPFVHTYVKYLKTNFNETDPEYKTLVAFLLGVESHIEADLIWHWGPSYNNTGDQGYLHSMGHDSSGCKDIWENCHPLGDIGADIYLPYKGQIKHRDIVWNIPTEHLLNIYRLYGDNTITNDAIGECTLLLYVVSRIEINLGNLILSFFQDEAAFLIEELDQWFTGGLDDMGINVAWKWNVIIDLLEGRNISDPDVNRHFYKKKQTNKFRDYILKVVKSLDKSTFNRLVELFEIENQISYTNNYMKNKVFSSNSNTKEKEEKINKELRIIFKDLISHKEKSIKNKETKIQKEKSLNFLNEELFEIEKNSIFELPKETKPISRIKNTYPYSYFGQSIASGNFSGNSKVETFISAPGFSLSGKPQIGAIYKISDVTNSSEVNYENPHLTGMDVYSRFGFSMLAMDVNDDGLDDLIVSAPTYGKNKYSAIEDYYAKEYFGEIFIFFGKENIGISLNQSPDRIIRTKSNDIFYNFGTVLSKNDCNNDGKEDLLIGSPYAVNENAKNFNGIGQVGKISIISNFDKLKEKKANNIYYIEEITEKHLLGESAWEWFGYSLTCFDNTVLVGAPGTRKNVEETQAHGAIIGYSFENLNQLFKIIHPNPQSKFGFSLSLNKQKSLLAVGAPSSRYKSQFNSGSVYLYETQRLKDLINSKNTTIDFNDIYKFNISSDLSYSRFGKSVQFTENNLIVGTPYFGNRDYLQQGEGAIYYFKELENIKNDLIADEDNNGFYRYDVKTGKFGNFIYLLQDNKENFKILISAPFSRNGRYEDLIGEVCVFDKSSFNN